jgi:protein SCO1/2
MRTLAFLLILMACGGRTSEPFQPPQAAPIARAESTEPSLYELGLTLRDATGQRIGLDAARGKPVLLTMFYASCNVACPALIEDVRRALAEMPADVQVMLVSFDPDRDTPAALAALATARGLDTRWTLAAADAADARELAAAFGYRYRKLENGEFFHGSTIVLLDEAGRPLAKTEGFGQHAALVAALR